MKGLTRAEKNRIERYGYTIGLNYFDDLTNPLFNKLKWDIEQNGKIDFKEQDGQTIHIYTPEIGYFLLSKELEVNVFMNQKMLTINGFTEFMPHYCEGYKAGEAYFEKEFRISKDTMYGINAKPYIQDLHDNYFHIKHKRTEAGYLEGWANIKRIFPFILKTSTFYDYGYFSGIVFKVDELKIKYANLFEDFGNCKLFQLYRPIENKKNLESKPEFITKEFHEIFNTPSLVDECLDLLRNTESPCINDERGFIKNKGAFVIWFNALESKKMFNCNFKNDAERAAILNHNFSNLNISQSLFGKENKRAKENYKTHFETEIAALKTF
jgi:hypothetical protein